jgi:hypothetical protein
MSEEKQTIVQLKKGFKCNRCYKEMDEDNVTYEVSIEKYYEPNRGSGFEMRLCGDCAQPIVDIVNKVRALKAMKPEDQPKLHTSKEVNEEE